MDMLKHDLKGTAMAPAQGLQGRIYSLDEAATKGLQPEKLDERAAIFHEAAKKDSRIDGHVGATIGTVKGSFPEFKEAYGRTIAKAIGQDFAHLSAALKAKSEGKYVEVANSDGTKERGIVSGDAADPKREGVWIEKDKEDRVRQIGSFTRGQPNGTFRSYREDGSLEASSYFKEGVQQLQAYQYNAKSEPVLKKEFKDGVELSSVTIDPEKAKQEKIERAKEFRENQALNKSLKIGR